MGQCSRRVGFCLVTAFAMTFTSEAVVSISACPCGALSMGSLSVTHDALHREAFQGSRTYRDRISDSQQWLGSPCLDCHIASTHCVRASYRSLLVRFPWDVPATGFIENHIVELITWTVIFFGYGDRDCARSFQNLLTIV